METAGYFEDTASEMDTLGDSNIGFKRRREMYKLGEGEYALSQSIIGRLPCEFTSPFAGIINGVNCKISLTLANPDFVIMTDSAKKIKYKIKSALLYAPVACLQEDLYIQMSKEIERKEAIIHYDRKECLQFNIPKNTLNWVSDVLFPSGNLPSKLCIVFVKTSAYEG